jgi:hypothetical protein
MTQAQRARTNDAALPPPQNLVDAERSVLGAILLDSSKLKVAAEIIGSSDFFSPKNGQPSENAIIFRELLAMASAGKGIDPLSLAVHLRNKGLLTSAEEQAYITDGLIDGMPQINSVEHHSKLIQDASLRRRLAHTAREIEQNAQAGESFADVIDRARLDLSRLAEQQQNATDIFDTWEEFKNSKPLRPLIESFLCADVANVVGGLSTEGKTLILMATVRALLTGKPLFGHFKVAEPLDRCIYLIPECARGPFYHRAKLFGLEPYIENRRLLVRTLTKGPCIALDDARLLRQVRDAYVAVDTAVRFSEGDESKAGDVANGLATDIFGLLAAGAACIQVAQHSPKSFAKDNYISLETCLRGSGDFGAFVGAGFGIRQVDKSLNVIHLEDIKPRDNDLLPAFQIIGRPETGRSYIAEEGDFRMHRLPGTCGKLAEYLNDIPSRNRGGASDTQKESKAANLELLRQWLTKEPQLSSQDLSKRFDNLGIKVGDSAIRRYRKELKL